MSARGLVTLASRLSIEDICAVFLRHALPKATAASADGRYAGSGKWLAPQLLLSHWPSNGSPNTCSRGISSASSLEGDTSAPPRQTQQHQGDIPQVAAADDAADLSFFDEQPEVDQLRTTQLGSGSSDGGCSGDGGGGGGSGGSGGAAEEGAGIDASLRAAARDVAASVAARAGPDAPPELFGWRGALTRGDEAELDNQSDLIQQRGELGKLARIVRVKRGSQRSSAEGGDDSSSNSSSLDGRERVLQRLGQLNCQEVAWAALDDADIEHVERISSDDPKEVRRLLALEVRKARRQAAEQKRAAAGGKARRRKAAEAAPGAASAPGAAAAASASELAAADPPSPAAAAHSADEPAPAAPAGDPAAAQPAGTPPADAAAAAKRGGAAPMGLGAYARQRTLVLQTMTKVQLAQACARRGLEWRSSPSQRPRGGGEWEFSRHALPKAQLVAAILEAELEGMQGVLQGR